MPEINIGIYLDFDTNTHQSAAFFCSLCMASLPHKVVSHRHGQYCWDQFVQYFQTISFFVLLLKFRDVNIIIPIILCPRVFLLKLDFAKFFLN